jgi:hypothetical protein
MRTPRSRLSYDAAIVLGSHARVWRKASVAPQLIWEIRWDGPRRRFYVTLDEIGIAQERARLEGPDDADQAAEALYSPGKIRQTVPGISQTPSAKS